MEVQHSFNSSAMDHTGMTAVIVRLDTENIRQTNSHSGDDQIRTFTDCDLYVDFVTDHQQHCVVLILTSCSNPEYLVSILHPFTNISVIYCHNNRGWTRNYSKVKLLIDQMDFNTVESIEKGPRNNHQDATFMFAELAKEILIADTSDDRQEFTDMCRLRAPTETKFIDELERNYSSHSSVYWYTRPSFLSNMLNHALRTHDIDVLYAMRIFIRDLYRQLQELQQSISPENALFTVYRGQGMSRKDFDNKLKNKVNGLLPISTFWSTSRDPAVANAYIHCDESNCIEGILFEIKIDSRTSPFADLQGQSAIHDEIEVLLSAGSVFRIVRIEQNVNKHWHVELQLTNSNTDEDLSKLGKDIRSGMGSGINTLERLGHLTILMGDYTKARNIYIRVIDEWDTTRHELEFAYLYNRFSGLYNSLGLDPNFSIYCSEKALKIEQKYLQDNDKLIWESCNNLGLAHRRMGNLKQALEYNYLCLSVSDQKLLTTALNNIGTLLIDQGEVDKALDYLMRAYTIRYDHVSSIDSSLAEIHHNIASVYLRKGDYSYARDIAKHALEIQKRSAPSNHPTIAVIYNTIACAYALMEQYDDALYNVEQAIQITPPEKQQELQELKLKILQKCKLIMKI